MTERASMQFTLNQTALNAAIAAELPRLLKDLEFNYTAGREPKGLTADVTVSEAMIRQAVTAYARRNVSANFTYFAIEFKATRGDDGITTNVTASDQPFNDEKAAPAPIQEPVEAAAEPASDPAPVEAEPSSVVEQGESSEELAADQEDAIEGVAEAPAPTRSKLFAGLARPDNTSKTDTL